MIPEFPLLRPVCTCTRGQMCPACREDARQHPHHQVPHDAPAPSPVVGRPVWLHVRLTAAHVDLVAQIQAGVPYRMLSEQYGVSENVLRCYLQATGAYVPRMAIKQEELRRMTSDILAAVAAGTPMAVVARQYNLSAHAVRCMRQRAGISHA